MTLPSVINLVVSGNTDQTALTVVPMPADFNLAVQHVIPYAELAGTTTNAQTASLATRAVTASYALTSAGTITNAVSSSYAISASYAPASFPYSGSAEITGSLVVTDQVKTPQLSLDSRQGLFVITGSVTTGILGVTETIYPIMSTSSYSGVTIEYLARRPSGVRVGMVMGTWLDGEYSFTDVSATDIGDTSDLMTGFLMVGDQVLFQVHSAGSGSGVWTVQTLFKLFPNWP